MLEIFFYLVLLEILFFSFTSYIRSKNQWFITAKDKKPIFNKVIVNKIFLRSYDSILGWDRKPNTTGFEKNKKNIVKWSINNNGARNNLEYNDEKSFIALFGDSFTFSREVNDNETWGYKLSCLMDSNVENFGVGNYGFDQALIKLTNKLKVENFKPRIVVIGVVPDTISRILSVWKHYYEYGNIFGFKPRYILKNDKIFLINNYINNKEKFYKIEEYLEKIQRDDFFYKNKFLKEVIDFPYTINFLKNFKRNIVLAYETLKKGQINDPTSTIMNRNLEKRVELYKNQHNIDLLIEELKLFKILSNEYNFKAYFLIMPQKDDVNYIKKHNFHFYEEMVNNVPNGITCIDMYKYLKNYSEEELNDIYSDNSDYGGHFSNKGNDIVARILDEKLIIRR